MPGWTGRNLQSGLRRKLHVEEFMSLASGNLSTPTANVLVVNCGSDHGALLDRVLETQSGIVFGVEPDPGLAEITRCSVRRQVNIFVGDIYVAAARGVRMDGSGPRIDFDVVFLLDGTLDAPTADFAERTACLDAIATLLKPNGVLVTSVDTPTDMPGFLYISWLPRASSTTLPASRPTDFVLPIPTTCALLQLAPDDAYNAAITQVRALVTASQKFRIEALHRQVESSRRHDIVYGICMTNYDVQSSIKYWAPWMSAEQLAEDEDAGECASDSSELADATAAKFSYDSCRDWLTARLVNGVDFARRAVTPWIRELSRSNDVPPGSEFHIEVVPGRCHVLLRRETPSRDGFELGESEGEGGEAG